MNTQHRTVGYIITAICVIIPAFVIIIYAMHALDFPHVKSNGYPYAKEELFVGESNPDTIGEPYYIGIDHIISDSSDQMIIRTEYGELYLYYDANSDFSQAIPSDINNMIEVFFVYCGWDEFLGIPYGTFLGARDTENHGTDLPAYKEVRINYTSIITAAQNTGMKTPEPLPAQE